jgi:hypothetical protein
MKVLLKDEELRLYYAGQDQWVAEVKAAVNFEVIDRAGRKALECPSRVMSVVLRYEEPECEVALNPAFCLPRVGMARSFVRT